MLETVVTLFTQVLLDSYLPGCPADGEDALWHSFVSPFQKIFRIKRNNSSIYRSRKNVRVENYRERQLDKYNFIYVSFFKKIRFIYLNIYTHVCS